MKKNESVIPAVVACAALVGLAATAIIAKMRLEREKVEYDEYVEPCTGKSGEEQNESEQYAYGIYAFDNPSDMNRAILSNKFNVDAYYEFEDKSYLVLLLDGNEDGIEGFNGRMISKEEFDEFEKRRKVETMYFEFESEEDFKELLGSMQNITQAEIKIPAVFYNEALYVDLSNFEQADHNKVSHMASEFLGTKITDLYVANKLEAWFAAIVEE